MKFWANLDNLAKYGLKAVQTVTSGIEQGNNVGKEIEILKEEFIQKEASVEALRITQWNSYIDVHGHLTKWVDSTKVKVVLRGSPAQRQKVLDSIRRDNEAIEEG